MNETQKSRTLIEDIKIGAEFVQQALIESNYNLEMTVDSLKEMDRFLNEQWDDENQQPKSEGVLAESTGSILFSLASLLGEIMICEYQGKWITDDNDPSGELNIAIKLDNGSTFYPAYLLMKRLQTGKEVSIYENALIAGKDKRAVKN